MKNVRLEPPRRTSRDKILSLRALAAVTEQLRGQGETIVHAHGTFDLLHAGHVKHLEGARKMGARLVVTVTADRFVNKGPGRPVFNEQLRAEMLASLEMVDFVAISESETAVEALHLIRPNVYVKGSDYVDAEQDITGNIRREQEAVESHGGRLGFTDEITFSSSSLLNSYFQAISHDLRSYLDARSRGPMLEQMINLIDKVQDYRVLMVGDAIIDEYDYVSPLGKPPKENLIATCFKSRELFAGGVIAAANHVASLCREVEVLTAVGTDDHYLELMRSALKPNVRLTEFVRPDNVTTRKVRFVESGYMRKLFEVYHMDDSPLAPALESAMADVIRDRSRNVNLVIATDFGHGLITPKIVSCLTEHAPFLAVNTQTNSANTGFNLVTKYPRADYVCIDAPEARLAVSDKASPIEDIAGRQLPQRIDCAHLVVTTGRDGCVCYDARNGVRAIPAFTNTVVDTIGAGDAFLSVTSPLVAAGGDIEQVGFIGNAAGAIKVGILGHRESVEKRHLVRYITTLLK